MLIYTEHINSKTLILVGTLQLTVKKISIFVCIEKLYLCGYTNKNSFEIKRAYFPTGFDEKINRQKKPTLPSPRQKISSKSSLSKNIYENSYIFIKL